MKIERIHVERYGAWQNLDLPVDSDGVSVFFGPNEAGKTTLMRFIRGVLYGFSDDDAKRHKGADFSQPWGGSLQVRHNEESWVVRRVGKYGTRGLVTARRIERDGEGPVTDGTALVRDLVGNVAESVYENVFAIGLPELQALATLEADNVAEHIYSLSMGLEGRRLLKLIDKVRRRRSDILDVDRGTGRLTEFYKRLDDIDSGLDASTESRRRHAKLCDDITRRENSIAEGKRRQRGLEQQLHGHEFMELVWEPWRNVRQLECELAKLPNVADFPRNSLSELNSMGTEIAALQQRRKTLLKEAKELRAKRQQIEIDPDLRRYAPTLQSFVDQKEWIAELVQFSQETQKNSVGLKEQLDARLKELGPSWSIERLRKMSVGHLGTACIAQRGREFQSVGRRMRRLRKHTQKLAQRCHRRQKFVDKAKLELGRETIAQAIARTREELTQLEDLSRLRIREAELQQRKVGVANQLHRLTIDPALPQWVSVVFTGLAIVGLVLGLSGLSLGLETNFIAGMGYFMLGLFCEGVTWALRKHFEGEVESTIRRLREEHRETEMRLDETRAAIKRIVPQSAVAVSVGRIEPLSDTDPRLAPTANAQEPVQRQPVPLIVTSELRSGIGVEVQGSYAEGYTSRVPTNWHGTREGEAPAEPQTALPQFEISNLRSAIGSSNDQLRAELTTDGASEAKPQASVVFRSAKERSFAERKATIDEPQSTNEIDLIQQGLERLRHFEKLGRMDDWVMQTRQKLIGLRARLRDANRDFGQSRQNWCHHLRDQGLDETINIDQAFGQRDLIARAAMLVARLEEMQTDVNLARKLFQRYRTRIEELGHTTLRWKRDYSNPLTVLDDWKKELTSVADKIQERRRLRKEIRSRRTQAAVCLPKLRRLESQRSALLVRGGALNVEDFKLRAQSIERRCVLDAELDQARAELADAAATDRNLAIVESDLEKFDDEANNAAIETITQELEDLDLDLEDSIGKLKDLKQDLRLLEADSTSSEMRFEREQVLSEITTLSEEWFALEWSLQTLDSLRMEFERNHQTPILIRAKEYLRRLSGDRYQNIWTPLGERTLCVENNAADTIRVENLSSGAQEQLFLAIRLALMEHFAKHGIELPIVLDDVLVNFDQDRTRAAIEELLRLSAGTHQILFFTCHQHLSDLFRQRGVGTLTLPAREAPERLAG